MSQPLLYLSLYLKWNRDEYYARLQRVRTHGEWEEWLRFFLEGVSDAGSATETTQRLLALVEEDRRAIHNLGRASGSALRLHELAIRQVAFRIPEAARARSFRGHHREYGCASRAPRDRPRGHRAASEQAVRLWQVPGRSPGRYDRSRTEQ